MPAWINSNQYGGSFNGFHGCQAVKPVGSMDWVDRASFIVCLTRLPNRSCSEARMCQTSDEETNRQGPSSKQAGLELKDLSFDAYKAQVMSRFCICFPFHCILQCFKQSIVEFFCRRRL